MKTTLLASLFFLGYSFEVSVLAEEKEYPDPWLPPADMVGDWNTINERFMKWEIAEFEFGGGVADGGSLIINFKTADAAEFGVLVACSNWRTKEDWKEEQQPIFLIFENKAYSISRGGVFEKRLLLMLNQAASKLKGVGNTRPSYIERLHDTVKSRILIDEYWPFSDLDLAGGVGDWNSRVSILHGNNWTFERLDLEGATGDWNKIQEQFKKWEIVEFNHWDTLGDCSTIFRFKTSDDSEIGILVPTIQPHYPDTAATDDPFENVDVDPEIFPQVIFIYFKRQLYLVEKGSATETILLAMLERAAKKLKGEDLLNPKYIECLREVVKSRNIPPYNFCPFDLLDSEDEQNAAPKP